MASDPGSEDARQTKKSDSLNRFVGWRVLTYQPEVNSTPRAEIRPLAEIAVDDSYSRSA